MNKMKSEVTSTPNVFPADILPNKNHPDSWVLTLSLPADVAKLFTAERRSVASESLLFYLPGGFCIAFIIMQAKSHQIRIIVPAYDKKSRAWLEQCMLKSEISCAFPTKLGNLANTSHTFKTEFCFPRDALAQIHRRPKTPPETVLLKIASSIPYLYKREAAASCFYELDVEEISVCVVRDFFNTDACLQAAAELTGRPVAPSNK